MRGYDPTVCGQLWKVVGDTPVCHVSVSLTVGPWQSLYCPPGSTLGWSEGWFIGLVYIEFREAIIEFVSALFELKKKSILMNSVNLRLDPLALKYPVLHNPSQNLKLKLKLGKSYKAHPLSLLYSLDSGLSLKLALYSARARNRP